ncbi:hypothetical protein BDQ17DRAFT_1499878 [Cyathus striatus]|nr:hypothetical protein BDQ17DRAFT_1499878 [Cyathus striatus]
MSDFNPGAISCPSTALDRTVIRTWVVGAIISGVGYGIVCLICFQCVFFLSKSTLASKEQRTRNIFLMFYTIAMLVLSSMAIAANAATTWNVIFDSTSFQLKNMNFFNVLGPVGSASFVLTNWASDGILIWRSIVIYRNCKSTIYRYGCRPLISVLFCYIFVVGIILIRAVSNSESVLPSGPISYVAVSMSLHVLMTATIVGRLSYFRRISIVTLGSREGKKLISIISMLLESAAIIVVIDTIALYTYSASRYRKRGQELVTKVEEQLDNV